MGRATRSCSSGAGRASELGDVLFFGSYDELRHPRIQVIRQGLAAHGVLVTVLNEPLGVDTAQRVEILRNPLRLAGFVATVIRRWIGLVRRCRRLTRPPDVVVVGYMGHLDVRLARMLFRRSTIILDHLIGLSDTAQDRRLDRRRLVTRVLEATDRRAIAAADIVVFDTVEHRDHLDTGARAAVVVPVGAPAQYHAVARMRTAPPDGGLRVLFFGLFTPLQGAVTIGRAIALLHDEPDVRFTMVGDGQDRGDALAAANNSHNVEWVPWVEPTELPGLLASHDVCLGIFGTTPKAQRVVPNKVYQGLAAGAAVVTSDTPAQRHILGDAALYVPVGDPEALARTLRELQTDRILLQRQQQRALDFARHSLTPEAVTRELAALLRHAAAPDPASRP